MFKFIDYLSILLCFTQVQVTNILEKIAQEKDGYNKILKYSLEAMMRADYKIHISKP